MPFEGFPLPRLADCRIAFACERYEVREIGHRHQALVFGLVKAIFVDDSAVSSGPQGRARVRADRVDPIGRLGGGEYVTFGTIIDIPRPD